MTGVEIRERVEGMLRAWNDRDLDRFLAFMTPDVDWHDLGMPYPPAVGHEAVRRFSESAKDRYFYGPFGWEVAVGRSVAWDTERGSLRWGRSPWSSEVWETPG